MLPLVGVTVVITLARQQQVAALAVLDTTQTLRVLVFRAKATLVLMALHLILVAVVAQELPVVIRVLLEPAFPEVQELGRTFQEQELFTAAVVEDQALAMERPEVLAVVGKEVVLFKGLTRQLTLAEVVVAIWLLVENLEVRVLR